MKKKILIGLFIIILFITAACTKNDLTDNAVLYKSTFCGCCEGYTSKLTGAGMNIDVKNMDDVSPIKVKHKIPSEMQSCHTMEIEGYFVEGHVPFEAIQKLLNEKPDIDGIALPGMPSGSPGMPGKKTAPFIIYAINHDGSSYEFMRI